MDAQQFAQLMAASRPPGRKAEPFSSGDGVEWRTWRRNFEITATINAWDARRQRREIAASMTGTAQLYVADIAIGDVQGAAPAADLLDLYEARFLPAAAGDLARVTFKDARQEEGDTQDTQGPHSPGVRREQESWPSEKIHSVPGSNTLA